MAVRGPALAHVHRWSEPSPSLAHILLFRVTPSSPTGRGRCPGPSCVDGLRIVSSVSRIKCLTTIESEWVLCTS